MTLQKFFQHENFPTKISYNENFPIYIWHMYVVCMYVCMHAVCISVTL